MQLQQPFLGGGEFCREIYQRPDLAKKLDESLYENILYPMVDEISALLIHHILSILASKGAKSIKYSTLYGEQGTHKIIDIKLETINLLCTDIITITISDENEDLVFTCYFDEISAVFLQKKIAERDWSKMGLRVLFLAKKLL